MQSFYRFSMVLVLVLLSASAQAQVAQKTGKTYNPDGDFKPFFEALYSTNNTSLFIQKLPLAGEFRTDLLEHLKKSKKKSYQVRKVSERVFEVQMSNGNWARMELGVPGGLMVGKSLFRLDSKKSNKENLVSLNNLLQKEYPAKSAWWSFFTKAFAVDVYDPDTVAIGATGAALASSWDVNTFLNGAEHYCDHGSLPPGMAVGNLLRGNLTNQTNPYEDREWVRRRFFESRNHFTQSTWMERNFSSNARYHDDAFNRFYKVQDCFLKKRLINSTEVREHPQHAIPQGYTPASQ